MKSPNPNWLSLQLLLLTLLACPVQAQQATLYRDTWGVPHIYSDSEQAGMYALGYAQAQDRLRDIYLAVRTAVGRMSEVQGKDMLQQDYIMRLTRNDTIHEEYLAQAPEQLRVNATAFVAGVQAYIDQHHLYPCPENSRKPLITT